MTSRDLHLATQVILTAALLAATSSVVWAHGAGGDIALFSTAGQADVGFAILDDDDDLQLVFDPEEDVFLSVLLPISQPNPIVPWDYGSAEPGFDADEGTLPPEADIAYNLLELHYWNGAGSSVALSPAPSIQAGVAPSPEKSFASGGFHSHPFFGVNDPSGLAAEGVYVGKLTVSVEGLDDSDPYYMVSLVTDEVTELATNDEQVEAAEAIGEMVRLYIEDPTLHPTPMYGSTDFTFYADAVAHVRALAAIPEPTTLALVGTTLLLCGASTRRRPFH